MIKQAERLSTTLLKLADDKTEDKKRELSISQHFPYVKQVVPSRMIIPLQDALTCTLPSSADTVKSHGPFPAAPVEIQSEHLFPRRADNSNGRSGRGHDIPATAEEARLHWHGWTTISVPL